MSRRTLVALLAGALCAMLATPARSGPPLALKYYTEFKLPNEFADDAALKTAVASFLDTLQLAHPAYLAVNVTLQAV